MAEQERERRIAERLERLERVALNAVAHVGSANYAEREAEAEGWIRKAFAEAAALLRDPEPGGIRESLLDDAMCFAVSYGLRHPITLEARAKALAAPAPTKTP